MSDRKLKVYLDTSVVSYLQQEDVPDRMAETLKLWKKFMTGCYDIYLSSMTTYEIDNCSKSKKNFLHSKLDEIEYTELGIDRDCLSLARDIIATGILTEKSFEDSQHIAVAVLNKCDVIVSWNFKHLVNIKTIKGIRKITQLKGYKDIEIITPTTLLEMEV
ncbi:MAG: PIN domain nuclease [Lachnospiraceae bacterium]|nr:PIN domain nuclease [Lachnospiraceae bacterium]